MQHYTMLARNLLYAAVTRGKRRVVIVGRRNFHRVPLWADPVGLPAARGPEKRD
jgi:ATP-dependent exoDNAse (exonuclease V) alpha subunit